MICFVGVSCLAQKQLERKINASAISLLQIDAANIFEVRLQTGNTDEIVVTAQLEGEYTKDLALGVYENGGTLAVNAGFRETFITPNDKLSAHKVVSIALHVFLPSWKKVQVYGTNARVIAQGEYTDLNIVLADGNCELMEVSQNISVRTQSGNITVKAKEGRIVASSKYGRVGKFILPTGSNHYDLSTVTGDIELRKPE
jgi:hypothetical protein